MCKIVQKNNPGFIMSLSNPSRKATGGVTTLRLPTPTDTEGQAAAIESRTSRLPRVACE
jgi:hypothetical protein